MHIIPIIIAVIVISLFTIFSHLKAGFDEKIKSGSVPPQIILISDETDLEGLTREDIRKRLVRLKNSIPPVHLELGAMCYELAMPPERTEYTCPVCGEKTLYSCEDTGAQDGRRVNCGVIEDIAWELDACRRLIERITVIKAELDESRFCSSCTPGEENPELGLIIHYPDAEKPHSVYGISSTDLVLVSEFLDGKKKHTTSNDAEIPLKEMINKLEYLLGVSIKNTDEQNI